MTAPFHHTPVLLSETIEALAPEPGGRFVDATLGAGGHAERILTMTSPNGALLGIDADPAALTAARARLAGFGDRLVTAHSTYDHLDEIAAESGFAGVNGVLFDLGVSSPQLDVPERGFSFSAEGPLDMRMNPTAGHTAEDLVNDLPQEQLERILREYGEERFAGRVARRIVAERERGRIETTTQLAEIVRRAKPRTNERIHPATRAFQGLRIAVNDELGRLQRALPQALSVLALGGRLAVISFHSLEDRIVKQFLRDEARGCICPPEVPKCICGHTPRVRLVTRKPIEASGEEVAANARARSARLRVAERIEHDITIPRG